MARVLLPKQISKDHMEKEDDNKRKRSRIKIKIKKDTTDHNISRSDKLVKNNIVALKVVDTAIAKKKQAKLSRKPVSKDSLQHHTSAFRGVTSHKWTGRYEAHLWDKYCWNQSRNRKGKQVYLGAYDDEEAAAHAYDLAALKYWGPQSILNFPLSTYEEELKDMEDQSNEEYVGSLRRKSSGFSRGVSKYRGVSRHHHNGRWEARIGRVLGNKYLYLGTFATQEEAATAYDMAAIEYRGLNAITNFDLSHYNKWPSCSHQEVNAHKNDSKFLSLTQNHQAADLSILSFPAASPSNKYSSEDADEAAPIRHGRDTVAASSSLTVHSVEENNLYATYSDTATTSLAAATISSRDEGECTEQDSGFSMCAEANDHIIHIEAEDMILGEAELNSFASSIFNFDQLHGSSSL